jgi:hypothetical protein
MSAHTPLDDRIQIQLCVPMQLMRLVNVRLLAEIRVLQQFWSSPKRFVHQGRALNQSSTFATCGIQDGDPIIVLPESDSDVDFVNSHWLLNLSRDEDAMKESMRSVANRALYVEYKKLEDLRYWQFEGRKRSQWERLGCSFIGPVEEAASVQLTTDYRCPSSPSVAPLPVMWDRRSNRK